MSSSSGCRLLISAIASWICPFKIISRILILSSRESKSTLGSIPDSIRNFSAASLKPSVKQENSCLRAHQFLGYLKWNLRLEINGNNTCHKVIHDEPVHISSLDVDIVEFIHPFLPCYVFRLLCITHYDILKRTEG